MRELDSSSVHRLIDVLSTIDHELRAIRTGTDTEERITLIRSKQAVLRELRRRKHRPPSVV
ncbi:hypothetical protein FB561_7599 [Kribbella amoyensis]|uniref:Uncharacterized protein n=1 Tax=Kribbella amoyensis TaxID=996641 RepID=A0A561AZF0_9ACTN|nr:hypothetical protein [Kribbella amoyensis]TWD72004.1 hypothetical protein FB561_7599 [Kribbella amoyensis]